MPCSSFNNEFSLLKDIGVSFNKQPSDAAEIRETLMFTALGIGVGLPITFILARLIASMLFGVKPDDFATLALAAFAICEVSLAAAYIPARRAAKMDPLVALRYD
jgi:ABC-type antimicrobial peptide transport system permease subunit